MKTARFAGSILLFTAGIILGVLLTVSAFTQYRLNDMRQVMSIIENNYIRRTDPSTLYTDTVRAMARSLDRYSDYLPHKEWEVYETELKGHYEGIGITIGKDTQNMYKIFAVHNGSPAEKAGLEPGDILLKVGDENTSSLAITDLSALLRGHSGSDVRLTIQRSGSVHDKIVTRGHVEYVPIVAKMIGTDKGYVRISSFTNIKNHIDGKLQRLHAQGARSFIIDLRYNLGGLLDEAVALCDAFIGDAVAVIVESRVRSANTTHKTKKNSRWEETPIIVLVNSQSASASEIFTGAVQDNKRGLVVGTRTYGKGVVQGTFQIGSGDRLKLTIAIYKTPSGRYIQRLNNENDYGIAPDIEVKTDDETEKLTARFLAGLESQGGLELVIPDYDIQLKKAVETLSAGAR